MQYKNYRLNRRQFLEKSLVGIGGLVLFPKVKNSAYELEEWPESEYLGRNTVYLPNTLRIRSKPSEHASEIRILREDECVPWLHEVIGDAPAFSPNKKWVETNEGYIFASSIQKVKNNKNQPILELPFFGEDRGMWAEVTVPWVLLELANPPARAPWLLEAPSNLWRMYYSQVVWVDDIKEEDGIVFYRINEKYGYGDIFWAEASAFRKVSEEEIAPIHPEAENRRIIVNINHQSLSCFEGDNEVYYCKISSGKKINALWEPDDTLATPPGTHWIWRKMISSHMSGGGTGAGWDTMAIPWTSYFVGTGVAIHSTFWHNDFGTPKSHGCVNVLADDAKWIFRWSSPVVTYFPGDAEPNLYEGTRIEVVEPSY